MSLMIEKNTGFPLGDPDVKPFEGIDISRDELDAALKPMILSASGWRKIFASDGDEESLREELLPSDRLLAAAMAEVFTDFILKRVHSPSPVIVLGLDARFTGPALADVMVRTLLSRGISIRYLFIVAAPELMGYTGRSEECDGFIYISASHNPIGHNGVKFGLNTGGVLSGEEAAELIRDFKVLLDDQTALDLLKNRVDGVGSDKVRDIYTQTDRWKIESYEVYRSFTATVISGLERPLEQKTFFDALKKGIGLRPLSVVAELNGSARTLTVDSEFLKELGAGVKVVNGAPRQITHRIVPEGESLDLCRRELETAAQVDPSYQLGYVPDNDGDRGNLVYYSSRDGKAHILEAQEVFALSVLAELAYLYWNGRMTDRTAVAVNGPTSGRIDDICEAFGCSTFRAEVGEANVVNLASEKRNAGWQIRILGEGSNGGNITWPAAVRDPLNTLGALLKILLLRSTEEKPGIFEIWCHLSEQTDRYKEDFDLQDVIDSLPAYTTTSAFDDRAMLRIKTMDHGELKKNYETVFLRDWELRKDDLRDRFGIVSWEEWNQEGTSSVPGVGPEYRSGAQRGGLTIRFRDEAGSFLGFLWMRGSGTEPVFRVLVDWKGSDPVAEEYLLNWQKSMIMEADGVCN